MSKKPITPSVSIITVNYNSGFGLERTIESIAPFFEVLNAELILVDGLSTDASLSRVENKDKLITTIISERDFGIYDAMNKGLERANGDWVWFLNSGDIALAPCVSVISRLSTLEDSVDLVYCDFITDSKKYVSQTLNLKNLFRGMINHQSIFYRKRLFGSFDLNYEFGADFAHLLKNYKKIKYIKINIPVVEYDLNGKSSSFTRASRVRIWYERYKAFKGSNLSIVWRIYGMVFSLSMCCVKAVLPKLGSRTLKLK